MKKEIIVKDNALINASYNLDLVEQRLILLAIVEARESGKGINANDPLEVHAESYINQFNVHRNTAYQSLKDACEDLFVRQFSYQSLSEKGNVINHKSRWVSEVAYVDNEAVVRLIFSPAIVPLITRLEEQFTKYEMQQISNLTSAYAVRLYEILIAWRSTGQTSLILLNDFRRKIGVLDTEYKRMYDFKKYVLDIAIKQVNQHTDIIVAVEQHKTGRSITGFSFSFKQKQTENKSSNLYKKLSLELSSSQIKLFSKKLSQLPEMSKYSEGTETYDEFAVRISKMLEDSTKLKELTPLLKKVGFK
ncbi:replication initiation protein RepM [Acinetobacter pollinis]|jgi:plasmid replication initiation protein|uniref:replication initiation protein RepM n=1 Tax=Acinetobacter pollinis TaxID=2605270 RepID=UPI0018C26A1B|nr:replication initiation protein RepM [Acinetobacter pollinis]MBF7694207.1 replication initiation protein [Acinetobacter pollinis]MBF7701799.1 replication initiation protein [Acinetobacter pollinis]